MFWLGALAPNVLGPDSKTLLKSRCCLQAILIYIVWLAGLVHGSDALKQPLHKPVCSIPDRVIGALC